MKSLSTTVRATNDLIDATHELVNTLAYMPMLGERWRDRALLTLQDMREALEELED